MSILQGSMRFMAFSASLPAKILVFLWVRLPASISRQDAAPTKNPKPAHDAILAAPRSE
jgi:hypothetical protein